MLEIGARDGRFASGVSATLQTTLSIVFSDSLFLDESRSTFSFAIARERLRPLLSGGIIAWLGSFVIDPGIIFSNEC